MHAQLCTTLCDTVDSSPPSSSIHGIFQARILEWVAFSYFRGSTRSRDGTRVSFIPCIVCQADSLPLAPTGMPAECSWEKVKQEIASTCSSWKGTNNWPWINRLIWLNSSWVKGLEYKAKHYCALILFINTHTEFALFCCPEGSISWRAVVLKWDSFVPQ